MQARFRSWWQNILQHRVAIGVVAIVLIAVIALIIAGYLFDWTGFNSYIGQPLKPNQEYRPEKTLWDWLQLLIITAVLAAGGYLFNYTTSKNERESTQLRDQTERDIALDNQREQALQAYINNMSELLLDKKLRESAEDDEVRKIARVRTLTVLPRLNAKRKGSLLQFLYESGLIDKGKHIVALEGANLSKAYLVFANLSGADLHRTDLRKASLNVANLSKADLSRAELIDTNLFRADLNEASLCEASLNGADLQEAKLMKANLSGAHLQGVNLQGANLSEANLQKAYLSREIEMESKEGKRYILISTESGANLQRASLVKANLSGADLHGVNLSEANLSETNLSGANLSGANLSDVNLKGATGITVEELEKRARSLQGATMPDGTKHP